MLHVSVEGLPIGVAIEQPEGFNVQATTNRLKLEKQERAHFTEFTEFVGIGHGGSRSVDWRVDAFRGVFGGSGP